MPDSRQNIGVGHGDFHAYHPGIEIGRLHLPAAMMMEEETS